MSRARIRKLFESRLKTWADAESPAVPIAWENTNFDPPKDRPWMRCTLIPADTGSDFVEGTDRRYVGLLALSLFVPRGHGAGPAEAVVAELESLFPMNLTLTDAGFTVRTTTPLSAGRADPEPDVFGIPMSLRYYAQN